MNANATSAPGIVDADRNPILTRSEVYSGVYGRASISFYAFNSSGNKGIACGLNNLQKIRDGEPLGGKASAEGNIEGPDTVSQTEYDELLALLDANGYCRKETDFHPAQEPEVEATSTDETGLTITIPLEDVNVGNLTNLLDAKGFLIKHALHIDDLRFELSEPETSSSTSTRSFGITTLKKLLRP